MEQRTSTGSYPEIHDLNGTWRFRLDPADEGESQRWFTADLNTVIQVPGSWEEQGFGDPPATTYLGGWTKKHQYTGAAWYQREIRLTELPTNGRVMLRLSGVRWRSRVWLDGDSVGEADSLSSPHEFDLTSLISLEKSQRLTVQIDNRMLVPLDESHINSLQTATWWGGITGGAALEITAAACIQQVMVRPNVPDSRFDFEVTVHSREASAQPVIIHVLVTDPQTGQVTQCTHEGHAQPGEQSVSISAEISDAHLWSDDDPFLYIVSVEMLHNGSLIDQREFRTGLRSIRQAGQQILLNGRPVFLRGYVDCCIFPNTGYPPWDKQEYLRQLGIAKAHGFNHVRLHSWHPPEPFWQAADEIGMLVQTELPNWTSHYGHYEQMAPESVHRYLLAELKRIIHAANTHPSWVLFSNGNELIYGADGHQQLNELLAHARQQDPTRLYTDNTGFGQLPGTAREVDYYIQSCNWHPPQRLYDAATPNSFEDFRAVTALTDKPVIGHEHGQFTMYVRPQEASKYQGVITPTWLESISKTLQAKHLNERVETFIDASGRHLVNAYKENIERARRTPGLAGFQLLDIRDFPGQGHATTGILDMFWDSKGLVDASDFAAFNGSQALLMRTAKRTVRAGQSLSVEIELSNFGDPIEDAVLHWQLVDQETLVASGDVKIERAESGQITRLAVLTPLTPVGSAHQLELRVQLGNVRNQWSFWSFPDADKQDYTGISTSLGVLRAVLPGADFSDNYAGTLLNIDRGSRKEFPDWQLAISQKLTYRLLQYLYDGGRVWLMPEAGQMYDTVSTRFIPPFWSYLHFPDNVSSVMGMLINQHPALAHFPHNGISDWQWFELVDGAPALCLDSVPHLSPVVEVIDNFNRAKRLAYAVEARVGRGSLFVSTWRLHSREVIQRPEARFLFHEVLRYLRSAEFNPAVDLTIGELLGLFRLTNARPTGFDD